MIHVLHQIAFIMTFPYEKGGIQSNDTYNNDNSNYYEKGNNWKRSKPFPLKDSTIKPRYIPRNEAKRSYPATEMNRRSNPRGYDDISDNEDTVTSNRSDKSSKYAKLGNKGMKPPMSVGMPAPGSSSNSKGENKMSETVKWILIFSIILVATVILLLTIYALWIWCSPVETNRVIIEEELRSEGMTDDELKRFKMRFGRE